MMSLLIISRFLINNNNNNYIRDSNDNYSVPIKQDNFYFLWPSILKEKELTAYQSRKDGDCPYEAPFHSKITGNLAFMIMQLF